VQRRRLGHHAEPLVGDAHLARHAAAAVGAEQIQAAHAVLAAGVVVADQRCHAFIVLLELEQLVVEADRRGGELLGAGLEQRLEADLRQVQLTPGARSAPVLVLAARAPAFQAGDLPPVVGIRAGEAGVERRRRHLMAGRAALGDRIGDPAVFEDLHRTQIQDVGLRQVRRPRPGADQQVVDALAGQQHRSGETGAATADDQDGRVLLGHGISSFVNHD
jgi:hypothetical protein